jgi:molybdenum-dependent DNA-binding transcriptional regulator ModE
MGRGKSKARQTKIARELKYSKIEMDLEQLSRDLHDNLNFDKHTASEHETQKNSSQREKD